MTSAEQILRSALARPALFVDHMPAYPLGAKTATDVPVGYARDVTEVAEASDGSGR